MSAPQSIRQQIAHGRSPDLETVGEVAGAQRLRLGDRGVRQRGERLGRQVLGAGPLERVLAEPGGAPLQRLQHRGHPVRPDSLRRREELRREELR